MDLSVLGVVSGAACEERDGVYSSTSQHSATWRSDQKLGRKETGFKLQLVNTGSHGGQIKSLRRKRRGLNFSKSTHYHLVGRSKACEERYGV